MSNARDRHKKIKKVSHAGNWFCVTDSGDFFNCNNAVIVIKIKQLATRKVHTDREKQIQNTHEVITDSGIRLEK